MAICSLTDLHDANNKIPERDKTRERRDLERTGERFTNYRLKVLVAVVDESKRLLCHFSEVRSIAKVPPENRIKLKTTGPFYPVKDDRLRGRTELLRVLEKCHKKRLPNLFRLPNYSVFGKGEMAEWPKATLC